MLEEPPEEPPEEEPDEEPDEVLVVLVEVESLLAFESLLELLDELELDSLELSFLALPPLL